MRVLRLQRLVSEWIHWIAYAGFGQARPAFTTWCRLVLLFPLSRERPQRSPTAFLPRCSRRRTPPRSPILGMHGPRWQKKHTATKRLGEPTAFLPDAADDGRLRAL